MAFHLFFGSIGTLADTSDMQRQAFNAAFDEAGLDWVWTPQEYRRRLQIVGGAQRIEAFAEEKGLSVDVAALHRAKSRHFQTMLRAGAIFPHPGLADLIDETRGAGGKVALVTTTSRGNLDALFAGLGARLSPDAFDLVIDRSLVARPKPAPDVYRLALDTLRLAAADTAAIEDTPENAAAPVGAGLKTYGLPGTYPPDSQWPEDVQRVDTLAEIARAERATRQRA